MTPVETQEPETTTAVVQIGNSDNKLTQAAWAEFIAETGYVIKKHSEHTHFAGASLPTEPWQNFAWAFEVRLRRLRLGALQHDLAELAARYEQDSIALTTGSTEFVGPAAPFLQR